MKGTIPYHGITEWPCGESKCTVDNAGQDEIVELAVVPGNKNASNRQPGIESNRTSVSCTKLKQPHFSNK